MSPAWIDHDGYSTLFIFGAGGHGREIAWLARETLPHGIAVRFIVDADHRRDPEVDGVPVDTLDTFRLSQDSRFVVAIGDPALRCAAARRLSAAGGRPATIVHPRVEMSELVTVEPGGVICAGTVVTTNVHLGSHAHVNIGCTVSHDVTIGDFSTLSPGVHVAGNVHIGAEVFIGIGASIINGRPGSPIVIGDGAVVAAGACVTGAVDAGALVAGVPAVRKR